MLRANSYHHFGRAAFPIVRRIRSRPGFRSHCHRLLPIASDIDPPSDKIHRRAADELSHENIVGLR